MPWVSSWVAPEVFVAHNDVTIYHTYKDNEQDQGQRNSWFGWAEDCTDDEPETTFDVRELPAYDADHVERYRLEVVGIAKGAQAAGDGKAFHDLRESFHDFRIAYYKQVIIAAIESGYLTADGPADRQESKKEETE